MARDRGGCWGVVGGDRGCGWRRCGGCLGVSMVFDCVCGWEDLGGAAESVCGVSLGVSPLKCRLGSALRPFHAIWGLCWYNF